MINTRYMGPILIETLRGKRASEMFSAKNFQGKLSTKTHDLDFAARKGVVAFYGKCTFSLLSLSLQ